jgi:hypothetical protein
MISKNPFGYGNKSRTGMMAARIPWPMSSPITTDDGRDIKEFDAKNSTSRIRDPEFDTQELDIKI